MAMRALVIGGNRFFGRRLVSKLLDSRADVTILNRGRTPDPFGDQVRRITMDRSQLSSKAPQLRNERWDVVYDQVCYEAHEARQACETFSGRVSHYVFTSTKSVYNCGPALVEDDFRPLKHVFDKAANKNSNYGEAKRQCEAVFFQERAFELTALRLPFVLGSDDYTRRLSFHVERVAKGLPIYFPSLDAKISLVSAADAAGALHFLAGLAQGAGPVNCASPDPISPRELVALIEKASGKQAKILVHPQDSTHSPYGAEADCWMQTTKFSKLGFEASSLSSWLPQLIEAELGFT